MTRSLVFTVIILFGLLLNAQIQQTVETKSEPKTETKATVTVETEPVKKDPSTQEKIKNGINNATQSAENFLNDSAVLRLQRPYGVYLHYSPIDFLIPSKIGGSFYFSNTDLSKQYEIQYLYGSISTGVSSYDFGKFSEQRISFLVRNYSSLSSFNFYYGISHNKTHITFGNEFMVTIPAQDRPNAEILNIESINLDIGIGNRWYYNNFSIGVDWVGLSQPVISLKKSAPFVEETTDDDKKDDVDTFLKIGTYFPRLYLLKLNLGYTF